MVVGVGPAPVGFGVAVAVVMYEPNICSENVRRNGPVAEGRANPPDQSRCGARVAPHRRVTRECACAALIPTRATTGGGIQIRSRTQADSRLLVRERLRSAFTAADDWAKTEAMPSQEEITRIRRLIARIKADVDDLTEHDRAQVTEAIDVVRRGRGTIVGLGLPQIPQPTPDIRPYRSA